jgi:hypothetical protein
MLSLVMLEAKLVLICATNGAGKNKTAMANEASHRQWRFIVPQKFMR